MSAGDRDTLAAVIGKANRPHLSPAAREAEDRSWLWLADVLLASDWLREQRADAWEEGHRSPRRMTVDLTDGNPYRTTEDTDAH